MRLFAHPFRLDANGSVVTVEQDSDAAVAQEIGAMLGTRRGERDLVPAFGVSDPVWEGPLEIAEVQAGLALFGPAVDVGEIVIDYPDNVTEQVSVSWQRTPVPA